MTNILATILIATNTHWATIKVEPSDMICAVLGCKADHSEKRTEIEVRYRVKQAVFVYEGKTNTVILNSETIVEPQKKRVQYSGWDYEIPRQSHKTNAWTRTNQTIWYMR